MPSIGNNGGSNKDDEDSKTLFAGAPPTSDDPTMNYLLNEIRALKATVSKQEATLKSLSLGFKARYVDLGGDTLYYSNLGVLKGRLRTLCNGNKEILEKFDAWAKLQNFKGNVRVALTMLGGAAIGAGIGGAVAGAAHCGIVIAGAIGASIAAGPAAGIVLGCVAGGLLIAFIGWGIYKLYQKNQLKKVKEEELEPEERQALQNFSQNLLLYSTDSAQ